MLKEQGSGIFDICIFEYTTLNVMANKNLKLTSVKIVDHLFEDFKISSIRYKFNLQKLANRAVHLYLTDEDFRKQIHNHTDLTISGSL
tara:strand:+ start:413 stop:676 length:264 start_codon:yes stop_codon:yes gene_type:complete